MKSLAYLESKDQRKWHELADVSSLRRMRFLLELKESDIVCDVGTGTGNAAVELSKTAKHIIAFDSVDRSQVFTKAQRRKIKFRQHNLSNGRLPIEAASVDVVVCRAALHHLESKMEFFQDAFRVLRPSGRLYVMDPVMSPSLRFAWSIISRIAERDYRSYCTEDELRGGLTAAGFEIRYQGAFLFPRYLKDWIESKICEIDSSSGHEELTSLACHVRSTIWELVTVFFPDDLQKELHLVKNSSDGRFAYNCLEIIATKKGRVI